MGSVSNRCLTASWVVSPTAMAPGVATNSSSRAAMFTVLPSTV